jgi:selenide,water dikinase
VHVDLCRLTEPAGVRHCRDEAVGIARGSRKVLCRNRPRMADDALPINIGSMPRPAGVAGTGEQNLPVKPIRRFNERWLAFRTDAP